MPINRLKRSMRSALQNAQNWATVIQLTLEGNQVEKRAPLYRAEHPVLLIPGFGSTRRTLSILEHRLYRDGFTVLSLNLGGIFDTFNSHKIEHLALLIRDKIETLYERYHFAGKMSIIGHSKGGLIGRYYVQFLGGEERVRHLITLGTPHNGNIWAFLGSMTPISWVMQSIKQMAPHSPLIKAFQETPLPTTVHLTSIYSTDDAINPCPSAVIQMDSEAHHIRNILLEGIGHSEFLIKKSVYGHIKRLLRESDGHSLPHPSLSTKANLRLVKTA